MSARPSFQGARAARTRSPTAARTPVTAMSCSLRARTAASARNPATPHDFGHPARFVHGHLAVVPAVLAAAALASGCVIPPSLSLEENDAAVNSAPLIVDVRDEAGNVFERPGPRDIVVGQGRLVLTLSDPDLADTLYVRYFLDYGVAEPTAPLVQCEAGPGAAPTLQRQITCPLAGVCNSVDVGPGHYFEIEVYDRVPVNDNTRPRPYRELDAPGLSSAWWWQAGCVEAAR